MQVKKFSTAKHDPLHCFIKAKFEYTLLNSKFKSSFLLKKFKLFYLRKKSIKFSKKILQKMLE